MECRIREEIESSLNGTSIKSIWDPNKKDGDPSFIHVNDPPPDSARDMPGIVTHQATHSTAKPIDQTADGAMTVPSQEPDECGGEVDLDRNVVNIRCGDSSLPVDFKDASYSPLPVDINADRVRAGIGAAEYYLRHNGDCRNFLNKVIRELRPDAEEVNFLSGLETDVSTGKLRTTFISIEGLLALAGSAQIVTVRSDGQSKANGFVVLTNQMAAKPGFIYVYNDFSRMTPEEVKYGVIHESFHLLKGVSDIDLFRAAQIAAGKGEIKQANDSVDASVKFNEIVSQNCKGLETGNTTTIRLSR